MHIAILGTRGIPAQYGGFETMAWELAGRLAAKGHIVTVYCRRGRTDETLTTPPGVQRRFLPYLPGKYLETVTHTALSALDSAVHRYDAVLVVNAANAAFAGLPRVRGTVVALNVDGIERQRAKWGLAGRLWYALGERFALVFPNAVVADAQVIQDYYLQRYRHRTSLIAYGATGLPREPPPDLKRHGLEGVLAGQYFLYVSRLEPENQALLVIEAYKRVSGTNPLLIVGDAPYALEYKAALQAAAARDPRVRLVGAIYGAGYSDLQRGALAYIQATTVGGTHPALIESMAAGNLVLAFATPENIEVTGGTALIFRSRDELAMTLDQIVREPDGTQYTTLRAAALERARSTYSWDRVTDQYEALFSSLIDRRARRGKP